jgi:hypothetical protein
MAYVVKRSGVEARGADYCLWKGRGLEEREKPNEIMIVGEEKERTIGN